MQHPKPVSQLPSAQPVKPIQTPKPVSQKQRVQPIQHPKPVFQLPSAQPANPIQTTKPVYHSKPIDPPVLKEHPNPAPKPEAQYPGTYFNSSNQF